MTRLILIRHSQPAIDPCVSPAQWPLSALGRQRCVPLARLLARYQPAALYASQEAKAAETAALVAHELGLPYHTRPGLHEHLRTIDDWLTEVEFKARIAALFAHPSEVVFGLESADQAHARFSAAVSSVLAEEPTGTPAIVTHGTVLSLFVGRAAGLDPAALWSSLGLPALIVLDRASLAIEHTFEVVAHDPNQVE